MSRSQRLGCPSADTEPECRMPGPPAAEAAAALRTEEQGPWIQLTVTSQADESSLVIFISLSAATVTEARSSRSVLATVEE